MKPRSDPVGEILESRSLDKKHCILCGIKLGAKNRSREHIFPKFLLRALNLWEQKLTLLNGTTLPYRRVVIPCCRRCNNQHIGRLDRTMAQKMRAGYTKFKNINEPLMFQWLSRILYSILYLELITPRDPRFSRRKILKKDFFRTLETAFLFLSSVRVKTHFHKPFPWSLFIFKTQQSADVRRNFDFADNPLSLTIALRANDIGVVAALQDNGAVKALGEGALGIRDTKKLALHPIQFSEVTARIFYAAGLINRVPKYMTVSSPDGKMNVVALPLQGLSSTPVFNAWRDEEYARLLSRTCRIPYEQLYHPGRGVLTFLRDESGRPKYIPVDDA